eukprot:TRINITY_DN3741_c0_g1_i2.p1 TRINITY_DN3741_c0_g1~~TRINITY_DN3741_c0_g1_i2.p1  ORF type:complete len:828 (-),score=195.86 TRINITY_DN3741_c0_g1_i2:87-2570(-)
MSFKNMCFQQPELTACLAELSSTVAELASRHYDLPSPRLAWPELQALPPSHEQHKPARCDAMQLSWRQNADSRAELQTAEPARCDAAEAEQAVEGSQLQAIIERQVRALQDVTNIADKRDGQDKDDMDLAVFRGVSFNKHKRASPCAQCGGLFFPMSLKIHQERCLARPPSSPPSPAPAAAAAQQNQPAAYAACAAEDCLARPSPAPAAGARQWKQPAPRAARAAEDRCSAKSPPPSVPAAAAGQRNQPAPVAACAAEACLARPRPSSPPVLAAGAQQRKQPARQAAWAAEDHCSARASSAPPAPEAAEQKNQTAPRIACAAEDWLARPALADRAEQQNQPASRTACAAEEGDDAEQTWRYTCPPPSPADSESLYRLTSCAEIRHATVHKSHSLCTSMVVDDKDCNTFIDFEGACASDASSDELIPDACFTGLDPCSKAWALAEAMDAETKGCAAKATQCSFARYEPAQRRRSESKRRAQSSHETGPHAFCTSMVGDDKCCKEATHCEVASASDASSANECASSISAFQSASTPLYELVPDACVASLETCSKAGFMADALANKRNTCAAKATQSSLARHEPVRRYRSKSKGSAQNSSGTGLARYTRAQPVDFSHHRKSEPIGLKMRSGPVSAQHAPASLAPTTSTSSRRKNASKQPRSNMGQHAGAAERKATNQEAVHRSLPQASCEQEQDEPCEGEEAWLSKEQQQQQPAASDDALQTPQALQSQWALDACVEPRPCDTIRRDEHAWLSPAKQAAPKKRLERIPRSWQVLSRVQLQEGGEEDCLQVPPGVVSVAVTKPRPRAGGGAPRGSSSRRRQHFAGTTPSFR